MANTSNLDLVKPAGTDYALISVINSNMDKIDTYAGNTNNKVNTYDFGTVTLSAFQTALASFISSNLTSNGVYRPIIVNISAASDPFIAQRYNGWVTRQSASNYVITLTGTNTQDITGHYINSPVTWDWSSLTDKLANFTSKISETITTDSNGIAITSYSRSDYTCISATSGNSLIVPFVQTNGDGGKIGVRVTRQNGNPITNETFSINMLLMRISS